ncbi:lytic murein transglycosylase [Micromonospora sp. NPDC005298]|uniref:lytic murein transglycosylase n=1 Tax=Micromonospora sp. NPDC005298 TaxID=3156873 RepID=UPI0033A46174
MVDGEDKMRVRPLRPSAPLDGPLEGSGAAPDPAPRAVPRPRRPWLSGGSTTSPSTSPTADAPSGEPEPVKPSGEPEPTRATTGPDAAAAGTSTSETAVTAPATDLTVTTVDTTPVPAVTDPGRRRRVPFAHAVRLPPPRQAATTAARATRAWARRPSGRLTLPGVFLLALVAATAAAGALLVPATVRAPRPVAADSSETPTAAPPPLGLPSGGLPTALPSGGVPTGGPTGGFPTGGFPTGPVVPPVVGGRPSDALASWAQQVGARVGVPPVAMQAYGYAELVLAQTNRSCALSWTTLAAIGQVESGHGSANDARLGQDGRALPEIIGEPLDGNGGRMRIIDTDRGALDKDATFDHAIGPMQFIPTTWQEIGADADNDGRKDPHDLDDAALAAANYLCKGGRNLSIPGDWWNAILSYNDVRRYAQDVFDTANRYGRASRT